MRLRDAVFAAAIGTLLAVPAAAQDHGRAFPGAMPPPGPPMAWQGQGQVPGQGGWQQPWAAGPQAGPAGAGPQNRDEWLRECRRRLGDNGVGGAVIGAVTGGVLGNAIGGRGNRVVGTVAGAVAGAVAGRAIDKAEDSARNRDQCEAMLAAPQPAAAPYGYAPYGYAPYGYAPYGYMMVPVMMVPAPQAAKGECKETVTTTEYVTYETRRTRSIPRRAPDKRVRIVPDKRSPR